MAHAGPPLFGLAVVQRRVTETEPCAGRRAAIEYGGQYSPIFLNFAEECNP